MSSVPGPPAQALAEPQAAEIMAALDALAQAPRGVSFLPAQHIGWVQAVRRFYAQRDNRPAWSAPGRLQALLQQLQALRDDGLDPGDYGTRSLGLAVAVGDRRAAAQREVEATAAYLLALVHLYHGKVDPRRLDPSWNIEPEALDTEQALQSALTAVDTGDLAAVFAAARPQDQIYAQLRAALAALREVQARDGGWPWIPPGPSLKPGMVDARVPLLRARLQALDATAVPAAGRPAAADEGTAQVMFYDPTLVAAVQRFQREQYLEADGVIGAQTLAALNVPIAARIDQLRVNLERARWLLHEKRGRLVVVDIAGYKLRVYDGGAQPLWGTRIQVGKPYRRTPLFKSAIDSITFNPGWVVPPTILRKDMLPKIRANPDYLAKNNLHVYDAQWHELSPQSVDWRQPPAGLRIRQDAGDDGALGRIKLNFPNPYAVYLHETPHKELFGKQQRAFSSGCIRVEDPLTLAAYVLDDAEHWNAAAIEAALSSGATRTIRVARPMPVLLAYWTVDIVPTPDGPPHIAFKPDVYGLDVDTLRALDVAPR